MTEPENDFGLDLPTIANRRAAAMHEIWSRSMLDAADLDNMVRCAFDEDVRALAWLLAEIPVEAVREQYACCFARSWFAHCDQARLQ